LNSLLFTIILPIEGKEPLLQIYLQTPVKWFARSLWMFGGCAFSGKAGILKEKDFNGS
jgi:hypothetical protein